MTKTDASNSGEEDSAPQPHTLTATMSLATLITNAIIKVSMTNPALDREGGPTAEEARADFTAKLLFELGLGPMPDAEHAPVTEPKEETKKAPKRPRKTKTSESETVKVEELTEQMGQLAIAEQPKPKKARKTKTESAPVSESESEKPVEKKKPGPKPKAKVAEPAPAPVPVAAPEPAAPKKKPGPKPKAKPEGPVNVEKLTPTHKKHLKAIAEELKVESKDKEFLAYANGMSAEEWGGKSLDDHIRDFLAPEPVPLAVPPKEFELVEFKGVDYLVDPETKFVYANVEEGAPVRDHIGVVGSFEFKDMEY